MAGIPDDKNGVEDRKSRSSSPDKPKLDVSFSSDDEDEIPDFEIQVRSRTVNNSTA